ncbi:unnamed protein product [Ceutorhynchus assimilis]|uniref:Cadherin domain-containing protein n=1 Tax=Ceutorhynchus assimilis TaxID=467358 RepID=A0A9N9QK40_9CUCU|nr:unnamed protein product [Ceutorhynchus assimilis]
MNLFPEYVTSVKMRNILLVVVLWLCAENVCVVKGQDCLFDQETIYINDTNIEEEIANIVVLSTAQYESFYVQDTVSAVDTTIAKKYFEFEKVDNTHLSFKTTADFRDLGSDADSNGAELILMTLYVTLKCGDIPNASPVIVAITCSFNNTPSFSTTTYPYSVPIPIMQKTDITVYGNEVTVTDTNFANTAMTFTIVPDDFEVTASKVDNKHFKAVFSAKNILQFYGEKTYTLTAENTGNQKSSVEITMAPDAKTSLDSPSFDDSYYYFNYDGATSMTPGNGDIKINSNKANEATLTLEGENSAYFTIKLDNSSKTLSLSSFNLPSNAPAQIILSLSFTTDSTAKTTLLINVAPVIPKFSNKHYSGTFDVNSKEISWKKEIGIEDATSVAIFEKSSLFSIDQTTYKITPNGDLSESDFDENLNIIFTLVATSSTSNTSEAAVVISLKTGTVDAFEFNSTYYTATYMKENSEWVVNLNSAIGFVDISDFGDIEIQVDESYSSNFKLEQDASKWKVSILSPLTNEVLNNNRKLAIPLTASKTGLNATIAVLILTLPDKVEINFGSLYYSGSYVQGPDNDTVVLTEEIIITGADAADVTIIVEEYQDYLHLEHDSGSSYKLTVKQNLNSTALNSKSPLLIIIAASTETSVAHTTLVLDLPDQSLQLKFEKPFYHAIYSEERIVLDDVSISLIKSDTLDVQFSCEGYDENFELIPDSTGDSYSIRVKSPLNDTSISQLSILITAFDSDSDISASTVLVITLPQESQALRFAKPYYSATYSVVDSQGLVTLTEAIHIIAADNLTVTFNVNDYDHNLKIESDSESSYTISVSRNLNSTILDYKSPLLIIMSASTETSVAYTTLVLDLPDKSLELEFEKQFYHATYSIDEQNHGTIIVDDSGIKIIKTDDLEVQLLCEGYENYLELLQDSATNFYTITVKNPLNETVIYSNTQLSILVKAVSSTSKISATTIVVLDLPSLEVFDTNQFVAEYQLSSDGNEYDIHFIGQVIGVRSTIFTQIIFTGYENIFEATCNATAECSVTVESNLNSTILNLNEELIITLAATNEDFSSTKTAVLLLKLPLKSFANDIYSGTYSVDEGSITNVDDITITNIDTSLVDVKLKDYTEYFSLKPNASKWTIEVTNLLPPDITSKQETLVTNLLAIRTSDKKTLAISTLQILLPTNIPKFEKFTYYGTYENSVDPEVKMEDKISLAADSLAAPKIYIDPKDEYIDYFDLSASKEEVLVTKPLGEDILDNVTSIALTLQAESEGGTSGHATIVISLPRKLRDSSIEVENQQVLFTGSYQDGSFKSPSITLNTNTTSDEDILVQISNDLGLDSALYFSYKYSSQVLTITTIAELPDDFLKSNKVLPLKLAIKDQSTKDTVYAVLNVEISSKSNNDQANSSTGVNTGLIVAVSILAVLLLMVLLAAFLFWFFKLRENPGVEITPEEALAPTKTKSFTKNEAKKQVMVSNALRRPTGIAIGLNPISQGESLTDDEHLNSVEPEAEKKVAFNENVEKIDNEIDDEDISDSERMQSVTDRRPTKFVFGYPPELGALRLSDKEDENGNLSDIETVTTKSSDFSNDVKKKGVAFDQNVERIDIEIEEGQESDTEKLENA